ncbi:MAG: translesion DNA synthesis-associated protein ImuA [Pseudomonadota bacterium]
MSSSAPLDNVLRDARIFRAGERARAGRGVSTGYPAFDRQLATAGWPRAALTEVLVDAPGHGELTLLMPTLSRLTQPRRDGDHRWVMWIAPPHIPYPPALKEQGVDLDRVMLVHATDRMDVLWAAEQSLRSGNCAAVLLWVHRAPIKAMRRLQLAASEGDSLGFVFRPTRCADEPSPATLRLMLGREGEKRQLHILKNRGGRPTALDADFLTP